MATGSAIWLRPTGRRFAGWSSSGAGPIDPDGVRDALRETPEIKAVLITHNETSTGVTHDLETIAGIVKGEFHKLLLVDAVSSLGCVALPVDGWKCDLVGTASQKGFMIPPGLSFISISPDGWEAQKTAAMPRFYFDLAVAREYLRTGQTPWTPNLSALYGLRLALTKMLDEGIENIFDRHGGIGQFTRSGVVEMGLELLCRDERRASNTVRAIRVPAGVDGAKLVGLDAHRGTGGSSGGQGELARDIFRIGHLGYVTPGGHIGGPGSAETGAAKGGLQRRLGPVSKHRLACNGAFCAPAFAGAQMPPLG